MRKWYIITTIVFLGLAFAALAFLLVSRAPAPDTATTTPKRGFVSFFGRQFGFGGDGNSSSTPATTTPEVRPTFRQRLALEEMLPVSNDMVAGMTFTASTTASSTIESARFVLRETGHIEDLSLETGDTERLSNTTIPRIQEAVFGANGSAVALRYLKEDNETIETYIAPLPTDPNASSTELAGSFFKQNIPDLAFSPDTSEVFYITIEETGATGRIANLSGSGSRTIFSSPLKEWLVNWGYSGAIDLFTKPSYLAFGVGERVSTTGDIRRTFSGTKGLTTLPSPGGTRILFSQSDGNSVRIFIRDLSSLTTTEFLVPTLPEKCVWADDVRVVCAVPAKITGLLPDVWYQGSISFDDSFWMLDGESGKVDFLFDPSDTPAHQTVDAIDLSLSHDNTVLSFINKKDLRGWVADLSKWFPR